MKVEIDTPGVTIRIEADDPLDDVSAKALALFRAAGGWPQHEGSAAGFASTERREDADTAHGYVWQAPVKAGFTLPTEMRETPR